MHPTVVAVEAKANAPPPRFRRREFVRLLAATCRFKTALVLGVLATVVFAGLHTVSVGAAFPIFKLLLEEEGLRGWVHRTVTGERLGAGLVMAGDGRLRAVSVDRQGLAAAEGVFPGDHLWDPRGRDAEALLQDIALAPPGSTIQVNTDSPARQAEEVEQSAGEPRLLTLRLGELDAHLRMLRRASGLLPPSAEQNRLGILVYLMAGLVAAIVLGNVFRYLGEVWIADAILRGMMMLRSDLYERTLHLPMSFFSGQSTSDLIGRFVQDIQEIQRGMLTLFSRFIREPLRATFILVLAFTLDWRLTLTMVVVTPIVVLVFWQVGRSVKKANRKLLRAYGRMIGTLTDSLHNLRVVKAYTAEAHERQRLRQVDLQVLTQQFKLAKLQALIGPMTETVAVLAGSFITLWMAQRVLRLELPMSNFAALGVALSVLFDPLRKLSDVYVRVQRATAGAERVFQVIDQPIESEGGGGEVELGPLKAFIEFDGVSFTYSGAERAALSNVSLTIQKGETIAIVGPNGSGKTTLVNMLPRLFIPDGGQIRYDGVDIQRATLRSLRRQFGLVTQEAVVLPGTPAENIAYGESADDAQRIHYAARRAFAEEFIRRIPGDYAAPLGERGTTLSGGERQRLAIARAIYRNAPILIFDEATSQIDSESELKIQSALRDFARGSAGAAGRRTTLIIAHRLSTILFADRIIVMEAGRIVDTGTHPELFARCDLYRALCETQFLSAPGVQSRHLGPEPSGVRPNG